MKLSELKEFDAAKYLKDEETVCRYLSEAFSDGDPQLMLAALRNVLRAASVATVAERAGVDVDAIEKALSRDGAAGLEAVNELLRVLGLRLQVVARQSK